MKQVVNFLGDKPVIGMVISYGTSAMAFFEKLASWLQILGIIVGTLIGILTLYLTIIKISNEKRTKKCLELEKRYDELRLNNEIKQSHK
jgi:uncharacterized membrane protein